MPVHESTPGDPASRTEETSVRVIFFDDMKGSTALKESISAQRDEQTFQELRKEHDALLTRIITRDDAGAVIKSTGDGLLAIFYRPSVAVERAIEIQESLRDHPHLSVRIGMDMGEVRAESAGERVIDVFGRHVDWAARAMALADGGHICVTRTVYTDAFSWITKSRIAWQEHGLHRMKAGEPPLDIFEPYNANVIKPMPALQGEKVATAPLGSQEPRAAGVKGREDQQTLRLARSWESVARDGRDFAESGAGMMYWFKVPLGGICYPEGFRSFLQPALANTRISKIRFVLDESNPVIRQLWQDLVLPLILDWGTQQNRSLRPASSTGGGKVLDADPTRPIPVAWAFVDLSREMSPCFKLFVDDPDTDDRVEAQAQIFLSTASRSVRFRDATVHSVRIPDGVLRVRSHEADSLIHALNSVANQWDSLF